MKKTFAPLMLLILSLASFTIIAQESNWVTIKSEEFGYSVEFPQQPKPIQQSVNTELGPMAMNMNMLDVSSIEGEDNLVYGVIQSVYPEGTIHSDSTEMLDSFFEGSVNGAVKNVRGELLSELIISLGKYPGREIKIDFQNGMAVIRMRMYLVENRTYILQTITATEKDFNKSITHFMDSFKLL